MIGQQPIDPVRWLGRLLPDEYYRRHYPPYRVWVVFSDDSASPWGPPWPTLEAASHAATEAMASQHLATQGMIAYTILDQAGRVAYGQLALPNALHQAATEEDRWR